MRFVTAGRWSQKRGVRATETPVRHAFASSRPTGRDPSSRGGALAGSQRPGLGCSGSPGFVRLSPSHGGAIVRQPAPTTARRSWLSANGIRLRGERLGARRRRSRRSRALRLILVAVLIGTVAGPSVPATCTTGSSRRSTGSSRARRPQTGPRSRPWKSRIRRRRRRRAPPRRTLRRPAVSRS